MIPSNAAGLLGGCHQRVDRTRPPAEPQACSRLMVEEHDETKMTSHPRRPRGGGALVVELLEMDHDEQGEWISGFHGQVCRQLKNHGGRTRPTARANCEREAGQRARQHGRQDDSAEHVEAGPRRGSPLHSLRGFALHLEQARGLQPNARRNGIADQRLRGDRDRRSRL